MPAPDHSDVLEMIYRAAAEPELWPRAVEVVADHVGAIAGNLVYQAPAGERSFLIPGRMREDLNALYLRHYAQNPYAHAYEKLRPNQVAIGNRLVDVQAINRSAFYADICAPQRIANQLFVAHPQLQQQGGIGGIALFLSPEQCEYEDAAAARLGRLTAHLSRAIDFTLLASQQAGNARLFEELIATMPSAALLLDRQGAIIQTNAAADALLRKADGLPPAARTACGWRRSCRRNSARLRTISGRRWRSRAARFAGSTGRCRSRARPGCRRCSCW